MTVVDRIFHQVAEISIPCFFITVEFAAMGSEVPKHIETFLQEKYNAILHGANGRKLIFTFFPTDKVVDERYALKNKTSLYIKKK